MNDEMLKALKYLRLGGLLAHWDEYLALARKQNFSHVRLLEHILAQECQIKSENARQIRLQRARIPDPYVMETFPFDRQPKLDKKKMLSLYDAFDFLAKKQNILWMGPTGCGKTGLATSFLMEAIHRGHTGRFILYADNRGNAVFLLLGKENKVVGAKLRGTTTVRRRAMAPGSQKDLGYFAVPAPGVTTAILCESAIDAISCFELHPFCLCVSTSGARPNPHWLPWLIRQGLEIYCGFDSDSTGETMASNMIALHPAIKRLRPSEHDWNDVLKQHRGVNPKAR